jgi:hypothetical protein
MIDKKQSSIKMTAFFLIKHDDEKSYLKTLSRDWA